MAKKLHENLELPIDEIRRTLAVSKVTFRQYLAILESDLALNA